MNGYVSMSEQLDNALKNSSLNDIRNSSLSSITQVADSPANVYEYLFVITLNADLGQGGKALAHFLKVGRWSSTAKVREGPGSVSDQARTGHSSLQNL